MNKTFLKNIDTNNIYSDLIDFPDQIESILNNNSFDSIDINKISNILICGMGGSAIGGDLLKSIVQDKCPYPIIINRDYSLPNWVSKKTLIILSSYSGNTEEVTSCLKQTITNNLQPIIVTSGGELLKVAKAKKLIYFVIPKGYMPRFALGYSISILMTIFIKIGFINKSILRKMNKTVNALKNDARLYSDLEKENEAIKLSKKIYNKFNIIYTSSNMEVVGLRFRAQLAENAKILSLHYIFPEQNHNEIEAFGNTDTSNMIIIWIHDKDNHDRIKDRFLITSSLYNKSIKQLHINFQGENYLERLFKLIYFFDWVSYYCALLNKTNPYHIPKISKLKSML